MPLSGSHSGRPRFRSNRIANFTESVIREMTRLAIQFDAVNLAQGYPDFPAPEILK
jgi:aminotransferase